MNRFGGNGNRSGGNRSGGGGNRFGGRSGGFRGFDDRPREKHKAVCAECKQNCEVPFKPTEGRPVYCKECFAKHRKF